MAARKGISLPQEFLAAAAQGGLRQSVLLQYALLQVGLGHYSEHLAFAAAFAGFLSTHHDLLLLSQAGFFTRFFSKAFPIVRNRLLSDPKFLFKIGAEVAIDAGKYPYLPCPTCKTMLADLLCANMADPYHIRTA